MRRLRILTKHLKAADVAQVKDLAAASGFAPDEVETIDAIGAPLEGCDDEIVVVVLTPGACADADLEGDVKQIANGARRAICVWPKDTSAEAIPPSSTRKYAYSVVCSDAAKFKAAAADDDVLIFDLPSGEPMPKVETERNLCVEEIKPK